MKISLVAALALAGVLAIFAGSAQTAPKPDLVPLSWQLDIKAEQPRPIEVYLPGQSKPTLFWYMRYTIANKTDEEQIFVPEFLLYTDTGQALRGGRGIPAVVFNRIKKLHNEPLLQTMTRMTGKVLKGRDNVKKGVAIWPDFDPKAGRIDIFVGGLSGETQRITLPKPVKVPDTDNPDKDKKITSVVISKTLRLRYALLGDVGERKRTRLDERPRIWVMR